MKIIIHFDIKERAEEMVIEATSIEDAQHRLNCFGLPESTVYLLSIEDSSCTPHLDEILITESLPMMRSFIESFDDNYCIDGAMVIHLQSYESYEDAYSVALGMREPNKLCYN